MMRSSFTAGSFTWLAGIEDTCVYPPGDPTRPALDEFDLTDHTQNWREDLTAVRDLGATGVRYGVCWPLVNPRRGVYDWSWLDERLHFAVDTLHLTVVVDLVHYGTPQWITDSFADPEYPQAVAEFAGALATRYRGIVNCFTPLNEPLTTASFCGLRGVWPPYRTGWHGWATVTMGIVNGIRASITAIRDANPDATIVHVEASALYRTEDPALMTDVEQLTDIARLPLALLMGKVTSSHPLHRWLTRHGVRPEELEPLTRSVPQIDLLGINYYPELTPRTLVRAPDGSVQQNTTDMHTDGLALVIRETWQAHLLPVLITETSREGDEWSREEWVAESVASVAELIDEGIDIRGYTWWPLTDFVDWSYASDGRNVEEFLLAHDTDSAEAVAQEQRFGDVARGRGAFLRRMGLLTLHETSSGALERTPNAAAAAFAAAARRDILTHEPI